MCAGDVCIQHPEIAMILPDMLLPFGANDKLSSCAEGVPRKAHVSNRPLMTYQDQAWLGG